MSLSQAHPAAPASGSRTGIQGEPAARALGAGAALAALLIAPLVMNPAAARVFGASKLPAIAPLAALMAASLVWLAILHTGQAGARRKSATAAGDPARAAWWGLAGFFVCALVSTLGSETPWIAFVGNYFRREGLAAWAIGGLVCVALYQAPRGTAMRAIDLLLLASVAPCVYALLQRAGLIAGTGGPLQLSAPLLRPGGSLGNPVFLGDFLMLLLPVCIARCMAVRATATNGRGCAPWIGLAALQAVVLVLTESRAPIGALLAALWLLAVLAAGLSGSRALFAAAISLAAALVLSLAAINLAPPATRFAQEVPVLKRFVLGAEDLSGVSRGGIWRAGLDSLRAAPAARGAFGYGLDAAHYAYFPYLPARVLQIEGQGDLIDRLHNEPLELAASVGLAGLAAYLFFLGAALRAARAGLWPEEAGTARSNLARFALAPWAAGIAGGVACALLPHGSGLAMMGVGFGAGAGLAWVALLVWRAWRALRERAGPRVISPREWMVAALAASLAGFWLDGQLTVPEMSTRMVFFALAGLLLALLRDGALAGEIPAAAEPRGFSSEAGILLCAALVPFFPLPFSGFAHYLIFTSHAALVVALAAPLLFAWGLGRAWSPQAGRGQALRACAFVALPGAVAYFGLSALLPVVGAPDEWILAGPVLWVWAWIAFCCALHARADALAVPVNVMPAPPDVPRRKQKRRAEAVAAAAPAMPRGAHAWPLAVLAFVLAAAALYCAAAEVRADSLSKLAGAEYGQGRHEQALGRVRRAAEIMPRESDYQATLGSRGLERAAALINNLHDADPRQFAFLADQLRESEAYSRRALELVPRDPWYLMYLANVLQFEGRVGMRPIMGDEGAAKAEEARRLFALAHERFPAHTVILHHWAQLEFDAGNAAAAYGLLDQMERLDPASEVPYAERMRMARFAGDIALFEATLARARRILPPEALERLIADAQPAVPAGR